MRETDTHIYFWGKGTIYSNFYLTPVDISFEGVNYRVKSSEHAYMLGKANFFCDYDAFKAILEANTPAYAKKIGRDVKYFDQELWNQVSFGVMLKCVHSKFLNNSNLLLELLSTKNKILVEASPVDLIWGVGLAEDNDLILDKKNWKGEVLMKVREGFMVKYG